MFCEECGHKNKQSAKFCRSCGNQLVESGSTGEKGIAGAAKTERSVGLSERLYGSKQFLLGIISFASAKMRGFTGRSVRSKRGLQAGVIIAVLLVGSAAFAAPKAQEYLEVRDALSTAEELESDGKYQEALETLTQVQDNWMFDSTEEELKKKIENEKLFVSDKQKMEKANELFENGEYVKARVKFEEISTKFPEYEKVKGRIVAASEKREEKLESQAEAERRAAQQAAAQQAAAERRARQRELEKKQAEEEARAAERERQRSEAQAAAAAAAAEEAERRREQAEREKQEQIRVSFYNQLLTIYTAVSDKGVGLISTALDHYQAGNDYTAISVMGQAKTIFDNAHDDALALEGAFPGLPSNYESALGSMKRAARQCSNTVSTFAKQYAGEHTLNDAAYYYESCESALDTVYNFLISQ